jgi:hypothetical protein
VEKRRDERRSGEARRSRYRIWFRDGEEEEHGFVVRVERGEREAARTC